MAGNGGYQRPSNPEQVSGPGALSKRTDGGPGETPTQAARYATGRGYGENKALNEAASGAPLDASGNATPMYSPTDGVNPSAAITSFGAPTERPNEPVTSGNPTPGSAGVGFEALGIPQAPPISQQDATRRQILLAMLEAEEARPGSDMSDSTRNLLRNLRAEVNS